MKACRILGAILSAIAPCLPSQPQANYGSLDGLFRLKPQNNQGQKRVLHFWVKQPLDSFDKDQRSRRRSYLFAGLSSADASFSKRGSLRSGSQIGSSLRSAGVTGAGL